MRSSLRARVAFLRPRVALAAVLAGVVVSGLACDTQRVIESVERAIAAIRLTPGAALLRVGTRMPLAATPVDALGVAVPNVTITWGVADTTVAQVTPTGEVWGRAPGHTTVRATAVSGTTEISATAPLDVTLVPVTTVTVTPVPATVVAGSVLQMVAVAADSAGQPLVGRGATWTSNNGAAATVSQAGVVTGVAAGQATISAVVEGRTGTSLVTVNPPPAPPPVVQQIVVTPASVTLATGATQQFTATAQMSNGTQQAAVVTWTATGGTVSGAGLYTAGSSAGSYRVIATQQGGTLADTAAITLTTAPPPPPGGALAWFEDFRISLTAKGMTHFAWNAPINRVPVSTATGSWPSGITHVAQNVYVAGMNAAYQAENLWPNPAVGQYLYVRMLVNNALPNGANTGGDHGFQTNAIGPIPWFCRIYGGNATSFQLDMTTWDQANGPNEMQINVPKNTVLRLEWRVQRTGTSTAVFTARVYNNQTGALLGQSNALTQTSPAGGSANPFREYLFGMSGQAGATYNGGAVYWGGLAVRVSNSADDWIGPYPVAGVEQP